MREQVCRNCRRCDGDGFPYGDIRCTVDGKLKNEYRTCDTGKFAVKLTLQQKHKLLHDTLSEVLAVFRDEDVLVTDEMKERWVVVLYDCKEDDTDGFNKSTVRGKGSH